MQTIENFTRLHSLKSTFGISQQYTGTASSYIKQSQLKKRMAASFPEGNSVMKFVHTHFRQISESERKRLIGKIEAFITKIPDMKECNVDRITDLLEDEGLLGFAIYLNNNLSKKIRWA